MNYADDVERTIGKLHIATRAETDEHILEDAYAALEKSARGQSTYIIRNVWQSILRNKIAKYAAVAAVIIAIAALFLNRPAPKISAPGQIDAALKKAENVCIARFHAGDTEPYEQVWTSTTLNVKLLKSTANERVQFVLWDIPNKVKMQTFLSSNFVQTEPITDQMLAELERSMIQNCGLIPYFDMEKIAEDVKWNRIDDPKVTAQAIGTKIFDLTWHQEDATTGEVKFRRWRVFADTKTNLPKSAEWYVKSKSQEEYSIESHTVFLYPDQEEIQALIRTTFGRTGRQPDEPGYIGTPRL